MTESHAEHLAETLELVRDEITWALANEWSTEFIRDKLRAMDGLLEMAQGEALDLVMGEQREVVTNESD